MKIKNDNNLFLFFSYEKMPYFQTKIKDWIDIDNIKNNNLSRNPNAIEYLK